MKTIEAPSFLAIWMYDTSNGADSPSTGKRGCGKYTPSTCVFSALADIACPFIGQRVSVPRRCRGPLGDLSCGPGRRDAKLIRELVGKGRRKFVRPFHDPIVEFQRDEHRGKL